MSFVFPPPAQAAVAITPVAAARLDRLEGGVDGLETLQVTLV